MKDKIFKNNHKTFTNIDPITVEVIRNSFTSIAKQMNQNLTRSAYTPIIYEMKDCSVGIFDRNINLVGQSSGLPVYLGTLGPAVKAVVESYKISEIKAANAKGLVIFFEQSVDLKTESEEGAFSKRQSEFLLSSFFKSTV